MRIRNERPEDRDVVHEINTSAFESSAEADLVDLLRENAHSVISLVAEDNERVTGHIMFSPVSIAGHQELQLMGLAPMAVSPAHQRTGIGSALVRAGIEKCRDMGAGAIVVLGHSQYYPRFGFRNASSFGISSEYDVPGDAFMLLELQDSYLHGVSGTVSYHDVFANV